MNGDGGRINGREVAEYKTSHLGHSGLFWIKNGAFVFGKFKEL